MEKEKETNPFLSYSQAIADTYNQTTESLAKGETKRKKRAYKQITDLLEEGFLLGATKFGDNFIA